MNASDNIISVGILHSLTGVMAISERPLVEAALMAIEEINRDGGVLGRRILPIIADGGSQPDQFAHQARRLIEQEEVTTLFGCWTSTSRKALKRVVEELNSLLWYPIQYEGLEESSHIVYTGSCLNQQIEPAVEWFLAQGKTRWLLVGSDYVFPRVANKLIASLVGSANAAVVADFYFPLEQTDFSSVLRAIAEQAPDIIFNTVNGQSNLAFFHLLHAAGVRPESLPVVSFSISEEEQAILGKEAAGNFACCSYFESIDTPENDDFVRRLRNHCGTSQHSSDPIISAYSQPFLWKHAVERAKSFRPTRVLQHLVGSRYQSPAGVFEIQPDHHVKKQALIGRALESGQFEIVWRSKGTIDPKPWLGVEDATLSRSAVIKSALERFPEAIYFTSLAKTEQDELAGIYANAPIGLCTFDREFRCRRLNQRLADLIGVSMERSIGEPIDVIMSELAPRMRGEAQKVLLTGKPSVHTEVAGRTPKSSDIRTFLFSCYPIFDTQQIMSGYGYVVEDITEQKQLEARLQQLNAELEQKVNERTRELAEVNATLMRLSRTDALTGLHNRLAADERLVAEQSLLKRTGQVYAVLVADIDHFKQINDKYGHAIGDDVLRFISVIFATNLRAHDFIGRYGGEEFIFILPATQIDQALAVAEKIRKAVAEAPHPIVGSITVSVGAAAASANQVDVDHVIQEADRHLYEAKKHGRNQVVGAARKAKASR